MKRLFPKLIALLILAAAIALPSAARADTPAQVKPLSDMTESGVLPATGFSVNARSAYLIELGSGAVLYAKNPNEDRYPASVTKILTALVTLENCSLDEEVTFSHASVTDLEDGGFDGRFKEGEVLTVEQCLYGLMLDSVNSCGYALAEHVAGSLAEFAALMNRKAQSIGCTNSNFVNPHGLNDDKHRTTAHDMALIMWNAIQNPDFLRIDSARTYHIDPTEKAPNGYTFTMHHKMMLPDSDQYFDVVVAGKTGYTSLAFSTLVTYAERDGKQLIAVIMKDSTGTAYSDTRKLLNYGFDKFASADLSNLAEGFENGARATLPLPIDLDADLQLYLPADTTNVSFNYSSGDNMGDETAVGSLLIKSGESAVTGRAMRVVEDKLTALNASSIADPSGVDIPGGTVGGDAQTEEPVGEGQTEESAGNPAATAQTGANQSGEQSGTAQTEEESGSFFGTVFKVFAWALLIAVIGIVGWWVTVQVIKYRRRKANEERVRRRARADRLRGIRDGRDRRQDGPRDPLDL